MKTTIIPIRYSTEKLEALRQYRTEAELQEGLEAVLQLIYEKYVPVDVRENMKDQQE